MVGRAVGAGDGAVVGRGVGRTAFAVGAGVGGAGVGAAEGAEVGFLVGHAVKDQPALHRTCGENQCNNATAQQCKIVRDPASQLQCTHSSTRSQRDFCTVCLSDKIQH